MTIHNRRISVLITLSVAVVAFGMTAVVTFTYIQVNNELREQTVSTVHNHLRSQQQVLIQQMRTIAEAKKTLLQVVMTTPAISPQEVRVLQRRFNRDFQAAQASVIFLPDRDPTLSPAFLATELQQIYQNENTYTSPQLPFRISIGELREAGGWYVGAPFSSAAGLRAIVPIAVSNFRGFHRPNAAIVAVDVTHILYSLMTNFFVTIDGSVWPLEIALYDREGALLASTLNNLWQQFPLLDQSTNARITWSSTGPRVPMIDPASLVVYQKDRITEVVYDAETGMFLAGSIAEPAITRRVAFISSQIVLIGVLNIGAILGLGLMLLHSIGQLSAAQEKQMEMYTRSIQAVLGPHFLFNSLDTIVGLAAEERKETLMRSLMALTIQLEGAMRNAANEVTVAQEMEYVASYLEIQGFRFDGRFTIDISVDPQIMYENIPRFCIQPVIENCFTHAIPESPELVQIALLIHPLDDKSIIVIVTDNGPGVSVERRRSLQETLQSRQVDWEAGIGLAAVNARLIESHGNNYGIRIVEPGDDILNKYRDTVKDGFTILMFLPRLGIEHEEG